MRDRSGSQYRRLPRHRGNRRGYRIVRFAFETARKYKREKVTAVHKANILKMSDGLFLQVARRVAREYADIGYEEAIVDATAMNLMMDPRQFDDSTSDFTTALIKAIEKS